LFWQDWFELNIVQAYSPSHDCICQIKGESAPQTSLPEDLYLAHRLRHRYRELIVRIKLRDGAAGVVGAITSRHSQPCERSLVVE
jgi:hypothetical protein